MRWQPVIKQAIPVTIVLFLWEIFCYLSELGKIIPAPHTVLAVFFTTIINGEIPFHILSSLQRILVGFTIAAVIAIVLAILAASQTAVRNIINPLVELLRPIPPIAWIPIAILLFGIGAISAYFIVFLGAFFPIFTNTYFGATSTPENYRFISRSLELSQLQYSKDILFKHALPAIFTGLRIGMGMAWMSVIAAEMIGAQSGLGYYIQMNRVVLGIDKIIVGMIAIGIIGFALVTIIGCAEKRLIPWESNDTRR